MFRNIETTLGKWRTGGMEEPLVIEGVHGCGKTYILRRFGEEQYGNMVYVNLESEKGMHRVFDRDLDPRRIIRDIASIKGVDISEGDTLLVLDKIQACPDAITSLKYFCEDAPGYHVTAAGSLLGVALARKSSFPVGKVDMMTMRPMDFEEFLVAAGHKTVVDRLRETGPFDSSQALIDLLEQEYLRYLFVGGMPRAVKAWIDGKGEEAVKEEQDRILTSYDSDFLKHVPDDHGPRVSRVWRQRADSAASITWRAEAMVRLGYCSSSTLVLLASM